MEVPLSFMKGMLGSISLNGQTLSEIYDNLEPHPWFYGWDALIPGVVAFTVITVARYVLDYVTRDFAHQCAMKKMEATTAPPWLLAIETVSTPISKSAYKELSDDKSLTPQQLSELKTYFVASKEYFKNMSKFEESLFKVVVFGSIYFYGIYILANHGDFFWDSRGMWAQGVPQQTNTVIEWYYGMQFGYHAHRSIYQDPTRADAVAMYIHHFVTTILIGGSWMSGYMLIGCTVVLCNDNLDLLMPLAKLTDAMNWDSLSNFFTIVFASLWIPFRIGVYAYKVLYSLLEPRGGFPVWGKDAFAWFFVGLLCVIYSLQFYWTYFLLTALYRKFVIKEKFTDPRDPKHHVE